MDKRLLVWFVLTLHAANVYAAGDVAGVAGDVTADTTWSDEVYLSGDLCVAPGATLYIEPGTRVTVARWDALSRTFLRHGDSYQIEISIKGALKINGTADAPVAFVPEPDGSPEGSWAGFKLHKDGTLSAEHAWLVGARWPLPRGAELGPGFFRVETTRHKNETYYPYAGVGPDRKTSYFYPDGTLIPKEVVKKRRGFSRWIITPSLSFAGFGIWYLLLPSPSYWEAYSGFLLTPAFFGLVGYLAGNEIDKDCGARRAQDDWLKERPDFTPPF